ncbi:MAG: hypothetical protein FJ333_11180 [Sphingomonadales bacterium]|nr:hypothetical protein [Sphingomonadales bacterium]
MKSGMNYVVWCSDSFCQVLFVPVLQHCQGVLYSVSDKTFSSYDCSSIVPGFRIDVELEPDSILVLTDDESGFPTLLFLVLSRFMWSSPFPVVELRERFREPTFVFISRVLRSRMYLGSWRSGWSDNHGVVPALIDLADSSRNQTGIVRCPTATGLPVVVVGASHARRLADEFDTHPGVVGELYTYRLCKGGWSPSAESVAGRVEELKELLPKLPRQSVIVLFLLDNAIYQVVDETGNVLHPVRDERGVYHVTEYLDLISSEKLKELLELINDILKICENFRVIFIGPLPRYLVIPCCSKTMHLKNRTHPNFSDILVDELSFVEDEIQGFLKGTSVQFVRSKDIFGLQNLFLRSTWKDGVHLSKIMYGNMAVFLRRMIWDF